MTAVLNWTGVTGQNYIRAITNDGAYIYAKLSLSAGKVIKIDMSTMTTVLITSGSYPPNYCRALTYDGAYVYAGLRVAPAMVTKMDPATLLTSDRWRGSAGGWQSRISTARKQAY